MMTEVQIIMSMAKKVREAVLKIAVTDDLKGYCAIASVALSKELDRLGYKNSIWEGEFRGDGHAWVICNGNIIDITASQFKGMPEIYIEQAYKKGCGYKPLYKITDIKNDFADWEPSCRPTEYNQGKINEIIRRYSSLLRTAR